MGIIREQDWRIKSEIEIPIVPTEGTLFKVGFVFQSDELTEIKHITTQDEFNEIFKNDSDESKWVQWLENSFYAIPYKDASNILESIQAVGRQCFILIFSEVATQTMENIELDWWGIKMYQNTIIKPWEDKAALELCMKERTGVFCDPEKEGKAFMLL